ncbi:PspC domain-containing protein [Winogradskyella aurantiaca]|nr:PspC domain-containing protein [Winogradskyella aurantiaca]
MILGVCEWLSLKLGWDVSMIRVAFVIGVLIFGAGLGLYLVLWVVKMFSE